MNDEVVHEDHEHRDDAQQLDAGIPLPPPICDSGMCRCAVFGSCLCSGCFLSIILLSPGPSLPKILRGWDDCVRRVSLFLG